MSSPSLTPEPTAPFITGTDYAPPGGWRNPRRGFLFFLGFATIGTGMAQLVPAVLTFPLKAAQIDPKNATSVLSIAIAIGALFALVAFPLFGRLSDRVTWSGGRRRPFLFLGAVLIAIASVVQFTASSVPLLVLSSILGFTGAAASTVAFTSILPDQIEPLHRGPASAVIGLSLPVGAVLGLFIAQLNQTSLAWQIFVPTAIGVIGILLLAIVLTDPPITKAQRPTFSFITFLSTFWTNPVKYPNFAWAWFSRFLLFFGVAAVQAYQVFYLVNHLHFTFKNVGTAVFLSTLVLSLFVLIFAPVSGKISDRIARRKPFVIIAAVIFAIGLVLASTATSFATFLVAMAVMGIGQGVYFAVDLALVSQILPDPQNPAKDLGIIGLASSLPSSVVPAIAPALLLIGATAANPQNFPALFLTGAIAAAVGALLIIPIRGVK
jgi:MFS family permease